MMTNGTIQYKITEGGGIDEESGNAIPVVESWSDPIEALITPGNGKLIKYQDGEQVAASYTVLLDLQDFKHVTIRLTDSVDESLGEYQVLPPNIRRMDTVGRVKITV